MSSVFWIDSMKRYKSKALQLIGYRHFINTLTYLLTYLMISKKLRRFISDKWLPRWLTSRKVLFQSRARSSTTTYAPALSSSMSHTMWWHLTLVLVSQSWAKHRQLLLMQLLLLIMMINTNKILLPAHGHAQRSQPSDSMGVIFLRFWTFSEFEN